MMRKQRKRKEKNIVSQFVHMVFVTIALIIILLFVSIICINCHSVGRDSEVKVESTLLATGMAIIGVAIAIWAGLNIIQVLEKDKFALLGDEFSKYKNERKILNELRFLDNVSSERNELNKYIYGRLKVEIEENEVDISPELYFELNRIEDLFQAAYKEQKLYKKSYQTDYYNAAIEKCRDLKRRVNRISSREIIELYIEIRILEFEFFKGYTVEKKEVQGCYQKVIDGFCRAFDGLGEPMQMVREKRYINDSIALTVYMFNTLGESYSRIINAYGKGERITNRIKNQAEKAQAYYEALLCLIESPEVMENDIKKEIIRETYYRNYGCALERISKNVRKNETVAFVYDSRIRQMYQKAIDIAMSNYEENIRYHTFYTWLSFYVKVMRNYRIKAVLECGEEIFLENSRVMKEYTLGATHYVEIAKRKYPELLFFIKFEAYIERDLALWALYEKNFDKAGVHTLNLKDIIGKLYILEQGKRKLKDSFPDDMLKELKKDCDMLQKRLFQKEKDLDEKS